MQASKGIDSTVFLKHSVRSSMSLRVVSNFYFVKFSLSPSYNLIYESYFCSKVTKNVFIPSINIFFIFAVSYLNSFVLFRYLLNICFLCLMTLSTNLRSLIVKRAAKTCFLNFLNLFFANIDGFGGSFRLGKGRLGYIY